MDNLYVFLWNDQYPLQCGGFVRTSFNKRAGKYNLFKRVIAEYQKGSRRLVLTTAGPRRCLLQLFEGEREIASEREFYKYGADWAFECVERKIGLLADSRRMPGKRIVRV